VIEIPSVSKYDGTIGSHDPAGISTTFPSSEAVKHRPRSGALPLRTAKEVGGYRPERHRHRVPPGEHGERGLVRVIDGGERVKAARPVLPQFQLGVGDPVPVDAALRIELPDANDGVSVRSKRLRRTASTTAKKPVTTPTPRASVTTVPRVKEALYNAAGIKKAQLAEFVRCAPPVRKR
jgi:hypothetical protein